MRRSLRKHPWSGFFLAASMSLPTLAFSFNDQEDAYDANAGINESVSQKPVELFKPPMVHPAKNLLDPRSLLELRASIAQLASLYEQLGFEIDLRHIEAELDILVALSEFEHELPPIVTITGMTNSGVSRMSQHFVSDAETSHEPGTTKTLAIYAPARLTKAQVELLLSPLGIVKQAWFQSTFQTQPKKSDPYRYYVQKKGLVPLILEIPGSILSEPLSDHAERLPLDAAYHLEDLRMVVIPGNYKDPRFLTALRHCRSDLLLVFDRNIFPNEEQLAQALKFFTLPKEKVHIAWRDENGYQMRLASETTFTTIEADSFPASVMSIPVLARFERTKQEKKQRVHDQLRKDIEEIRASLRQLESELEELKGTLYADMEKVTLPKIPSSYFRTRVLAIWESKHRDFLGVVPNWLKPIVNPVILPIQKVIEGQLERRVSTDRNYFLTLADQKFQAKQAAPLEIKAEKAVFLPLLELTISRLQSMRDSGRYSGEVLTEIERLLDPKVIMQLYKNFERDHTPHVLLEPGVNARIHSAIQRFAAEEPDTYRNMQKSGIRRNIAIAAASPVAATLMAEGGRQIVIHKILPMLFSSAAAQGTRMGFLKLALVKTGGFLTSAAVGAGLVTAAVIATPLIYRYLKRQKEGLEKSSLAHIVKKEEERHVNYRIQWFLQWMMSNYTGELIRLIENQRVHASLGESLFDPARTKCLRSLID